jgi:hypothetical protein
MRVNKILFFTGTIVFTFFAIAGCSSCGKNSPSGPQGTVNTATVTPTATITATTCPTFTFGQVIGSGSATVTLNYIFASRYKLAADAKITGFSFIALLSSGSILFAVFSDNAGEPGNLIAQTPFTAVSASGTQAVNLASPVDISAGNYWLACLTDTSSFISVSATGSGGSRYIGGPVNGYGSLADTFSANGTPGTNSSYYVEINALCTCQ